MSDAYGTLYDPWLAADSIQSQRRKADIDIVVGNRNVTDIMEPYILSVRVIDGWKGGEYQCEIELDDRDARLDIPNPDSTVKVSMGWKGEAMTLVFSGQVWDVEHGFGRKQGGRRMWVRAHGGNLLTSRVKEPMQDSLGSGAPRGKEQGKMLPLPDFIRQIAKNAKVNPVIHPALEGIKADFWNQSESFMHFGERMMRTYGITFRLLNGNEAHFSVPGYNADGSKGSTIDAVWGKNLIGWKVHPWVARSNWAGSKMPYYSSLLAEWKEVAGKFGMGLPWGIAKAVFSLPAPAPNSNQAGAANDGHGTQMKAGGGRIVINGEPRCQIACDLWVKGARPGVDGIWACTIIEHRWSRMGYQTWCDVEPKYNSAYGNVGTPYKDGTAGFVPTQEQIDYIIAGGLDETSPTYGAATLKLGGVETLSAVGSMIQGIDRTPAVMKARQESIDMGQGDPLAQYGAAPLTTQELTELRSGMTT